MNLVVAECAPNLGDLSVTPPKGLYEMSVKERSLWKRDINGNSNCITTKDKSWDCFDLTTNVGGTLYMLLEDAAGNIDIKNIRQAQVNIDQLSPNTPDSFQVLEPDPTILTSVTFLWNIPRDNGPAGLKEFTICMNEKEDFWNPIQSLIELKCNEFDKIWQKRKRIINTQFLVLRSGVESLP